MCGSISIVDLIFRVLEHIPLLGHFLALLYIPFSHSELTGRAIVKATFGFVFPFNFLIEIIDELIRKRSETKQDNKLDHRPKWMYQFHLKRLHHIILPGSQNSATAAFYKKTTILPLEKVWAKCQVLNISQQLMGGIRFLDLKILFDKRSSSVWVYSSDVLCMRLSEAFHQIHSFVITYSTEIVCVYMTAGGKQMDWNIVNQTINNILGDLMITSDMRDMAIGDIVNNGKNVAIFGVPDIPDVWELTYLWPNVANPEELRQNMAETLQTSFIIRDLPRLNWYFGVCKTTLAMKIRELGGIQGIIASRWVDEKFPSRLGLAKSANYQLWQVLRNVSKTSFNIISTECVDDDIIGKIISCNSKTNAGYAYVVNKMGEMEAVPLCSLEESELERMRVEGEKLQKEICYQTLVSNRSFESHV